MAHVFRAQWVLPIAAPPIRDGWVAVEGGRIAAVGDGSPPGNSVSELADAAILPGLVNAHVHLELSWMAGKVPPAESMPEWAGQLIACRRAVTVDPPSPMVTAIRDVRASGTCLVGDVTNTLAAYDLLVESDLWAAVFHELLGFSAADPARIIADAHAQISARKRDARIRTSLVPHATYSVSPSLLRAIGAASTGPLSVHVAESVEELQFLTDGTGTWRDLLSGLNVWNDAWRSPDCSPVEYLAKLGLVSDRLLAVHCVQATEDDLRLLAAANATVVTCPRSNQWTGAGTPPVGAFYESGVRVAIGTDSLASVEDLQMFKEVAAVRTLAPGVPARRLLESLTRVGAEALGFGDELGTIEPEKRAELIAVAVPPDIADVEEYLVSGRLRPDDIRWLEKDC